MKKSLMIAAKCVVALLLLSVLLLVFTPLGASLSVLFENVLVKWDIDNPHVDARFRDWKTVDVENFTRLKIPEQWQLTGEDGVIRIVSGQDIWAQGCVLDGQRFDTRADFVSWMTGCETASLTYEPLPGLTYMEGSEIGKFRMESDTPQTFYYQLFEDRVSSEEVPDLFLVLNENLANSEEQYDIAEAMVYAFAYTVRPEDQEIPE